MKFEILEERDNRLLNRKQYKVKITDCMQTPKREDVWKSFCAKQGMDEKKVIVDSVESSAGTKEVLAKIKYYDNEADLKRIELEGNVKTWKKLNGIVDAPLKEEPKTGEETPAPVKAESTQSAKAEKNKKEKSAQSAKAEEQKAESK